jgi:Ca2+-binding RTX toxin-like protein
MMIGGPGHDDLRARSGENQVNGNGGDDYLEAFGGVVRAGEGDDYVSVGATAIGYLGSGNDSATVAFGSTTLFGDAGNDVFAVSKKEQHATIDGGAGENRISFRGAGRSVSANIGQGTASWRDSDMSFTGVQNLAGGRKPDRLWGSAVSDFIIGGGGDDVIHGLGGNDLLKGGPGIDSINGGPDYDICAGEHYAGCEYSARPTLG